MYPFDFTTAHSKYPERFGIGNDYGVDERIKKAKGEWTDKGWHIPGNLDLSGLGLKQLPVLEYVRGDIDVSANVLKTLDGCPVEAFRKFWCFFNKLESLDKAPRSIGGSLYAFHNKITSLRNMPEFIGGDFWIYDNPLPPKIDLPRTTVVRGKVVLTDEGHRHIRR